MSEGDPTKATFDAVDVGTPPHRAGLTPSEVGRGVLASHRNARRLFCDAVSLFAQRRYAGALSLAILANEEAGKTLTIAMAGAFDHGTPPPRVGPQRRGLQIKDVWRGFGDHDSKNQETLNLHQLTGNFSPEAKAALASLDTRSTSKGYIRFRERATYVECVQGSERWSVPEQVISRDAALVIFTAVRKAMGRIIAPAVAAEVIGRLEATSELGRHALRQALLDWSKSEEASELSRLDLTETRDWIGQMDAALESADSGGEHEPGCS